MKVRLSKAEGNTKAIEPEQQIAAVIPAEVPGTKLETFDQKEAFARQVLDLSKEIVDMDPKERATYIRSKIPPFNYEPSPPHDNMKRIQVPLTTLENGDKYEGETD